MPNGEERLLEQIRAAPRDDELRMQYAEALRARGDEHGEYVRLAVSAGDDYREMTPEQRERWLAFEKKRTIWAANLGCADFSVEWRRGLPWSLTGTAEAFVRHRDVLRRLPIVSIAFSSSRAREPRLAAVAALPELGFIEQMTLPHGGSSRRGLPGGLRYYPLPRDEVAALFASPNLGRLLRLSFEEDALSEEAADVLAASGVLPQIEALTFGGILAASFAAVLRGATLPRLRELAISNSRLGEEGASAFAGCSLPALAELRLERASLVEGARILLGSRNLATVEKLVIHEDYLVRDSAAALGESPHPRALRHLSFHRAGIGTVAAIALASGHDAPFADLEKLDLSHCEIGDAGAIALAGSKRFPKLARLELADNGLSRDGAIAFVPPEAIPTLTVLGLGQNPFPSGETTYVTFIDQGMEVGGGDVSVPFGDDVIRAWYGGRRKLAVLLGHYSSAMSDLDVRNASSTNDA